MVGDVLADEAGDEVVAVVVARLQTQGQRMAGGRAGLLQALRLQLGLQELVRLARSTSSGRRSSAIAISSQASHCAQSAGLSPR